MKTYIQLALIAVAVTTQAQAQAQDINLTNRVATFTNLEGRVYQTVRLVKGTADGIVYKYDDGLGGGLINYTNLAPDLLATWGIPPERIEKARLRAASKAVQDAKFRAFQQQAARGDPARAAQYYADLEHQQKEQAADQARAQAARDRQAALEALDEEQRELDRQRARASDLNNSSDGYFFVPNEAQRQQSINERRRALQGH